MKLAWLLVFVIAMAPLAIADSIDYQASGTLAAHTAFTQGQIKVGHTWEVGDQLNQIDNLTTHHVVNGNLGFVDLTTGGLAKCVAGFCFTGGTLDIDSNKGTSIFDGTFTKGSISIANGITILNAFLSNGAATVIRLKQGQFSTQALVQSPHVIAEPAALGLMATGLLGIAFRRRFKWLRIPQCT